MTRPPLTPITCPVMKLGIVPGEERAHRRDVLGLTHAADRHRLLEQRTVRSEEPALLRGAQPWRVDHARRHGVGGDALRPERDGERPGQGDDRALHAE